MKILFNILGVLLGIVAAFLLSIALFLTPLVSAATKFFQPETIQQTLKEMDIQEELHKIVAGNAPSGLDGIDTAFVDDLVDSELMEDLLEIYIENLLGILEENDVTLLSEEQISPLLEKHLPEMTDLIKPHLPAEVSLTDEQIADYALNTLEPLLLEITSALPTLEDMGLDESKITLIQYTYDKTLLKYTLLAVAMLTVSILILRFPRFKGFMWLTIIYTCSSLLNFCINKYLLMDDIQHVEELFMPILEFFAAEYLSCALIGFVCAIVFLIIFIVGRMVFKPKETVEPTPLGNSY